ncbi:hypothetical protein I203_103186 [Kwoniella mangroviensis CBS 8507]|uniref:uncharacterized protein n=1 Tax=Kwoniella mangroviensis CBS 8507 TaxID=1296122 RepID=UPI00080D2DCC|nr:uncharacterized protein I203_07440 [Kwoniella mangroviensis CBS 8507]OCF63376.1 hypothetical protein I203_07440 [Kwoniella mangroviensis CBS 8507]
MLFDVPGLRWINQEARDAMTEEVAFSVDEREILAKDSERRVAIIKVVLLQSGVLTDKANTSGLSAQNLLERTFKLRDRFLNALGWSPDQPQLGGINSRLLRRHQYRVRVGENSKSPLDFPKDAGVPTSVSLRSKERKHRAQTPERRGRMKRFKGTIRDSEDEDELRMVIDDPFY